MLQLLDAAQRTVSLGGKALVVQVRDGLQGGLQVAILLPEVLVELQL